MKKTKNEENIALLEETLGICENALRTFRATRKGWTLLREYLVEGNQNVSQFVVDSANEMNDYQKSVFVQHVDAQLMSVWQTIFQLGAEVRWLKATLIKAENEKLGKESARRAKRLKGWYSRFV